MGQRLLILDDDDLVGEYIKFVAEDSGLEAETTTDSVEFMHQLERNRPSLVILDIFMPKEDGIEVMRKIAASRHNPALLFVSGSDPFYLETVTKLAMDMGLTQVRSMPKPLRRQDLQEFFKRSPQPQTTAI